MADFAAELRGQGHGPATVVKYHREAAAFAAWLGEEELTAERAAEYRDHLITCRTTTGANGAVSALNKLFAFLGRQDCRLRGLPVQRRLCRDEGPGADPGGVQAPPHRRPAEKAGAAAPGHGSYLRYRHPSV